MRKSKPIQARHSESYLELLAVKSLLHDIAGRIISYIHGNPVSVLGTDGWLTETAYVGFEGVNHENTCISFNDCDISLKDDHIIFSCSILGDPVIVLDDIDVKGKTIDEQEELVYDWLYADVDGQIKAFEAEEREKEKMARLKVTVCRSRAKRKGLECTIDADYMLHEILEQKCIYCGQTDWRKLGCDRIDNSIGYTPDNIVCSCTHCNTVRRNLYSVEEFKENADALTHVSTEESWERKRDYSKRYYEEHKDAVKEAQRQYREKHREENKEYCRQYYRENREAIRDYYKRYYREHKKKEE